MHKVKTGNFNIEAEAIGEWVVGFNEGSNLKNNELALKWSKYKKGETKAVPTANHTSKTIGVLIRGKIEIVLTDLGRTVLLEKEGDYIYLPPNTKHYHNVLDDTFLISVRWPALENDQY